MKINWLSSALIAFILFACLSGANAADVVQLSGYQGSALNDFENRMAYTQFYGTISGSVPASLISAPVQVDLAGRTPTYVYFGDAMQRVDYATYQPAASGNALWLRGVTEWSQYAEVPQGSMVNLLAVATREGQATFALYHPSGQRYEFNYFLYPTSQLQLYADAPGRYQLSYVMDGAASNTVIIDVTGTVTATTATGQTLYPIGGTNTDALGTVFGSPKLSTGPQANLDNQAILKEYQKMVNSAYWSGVDSDVAWYSAMDKWLNAA